MRQQTLDRGALVSGVLFIVLGALFLLDRLDAIDFQTAYVWPILLIGFGVAVLLGGRTNA